MICDGGSYPLPWGGTATSAGPYPHTYSSQAGCDSLVTINITVNQTYSTSETHAICHGGSYPLPWGGTATSAGPYPHTYSSQAGCDSLVTINITVNQTYSTSESHDLSGWFVLYHGAEQQQVQARILTRILRRQDVIVWQRLISP
ncbi:MAG: hypothetical protein IPL69_20355 [Saprospiraceae bacterium]|nr:hypothetical protein [Candidatus Brachybacter algidus]